MQTRFLRLPEVKERTGLSRSTIYDMISKGLFPRQIKLGIKAVGWVEEAIENWIIAKINSIRLTEKVDQ
ncbi:AlpA family transcriptional regulator [Paludibacterium sp.]|uniref:helix-turn-helix transcriptional regulator n=1 Tax=Paludibacterium sp. TaxID=1917523 RepID=UPI0025FC3A7B|nr:AlpA family transcriptional regulator [Paludibacterium sp.]MBV8647863.1 AlpA family transcriptional regulator [Paludibacterium sp.]